MDKKYHRLSYAERYYIKKEMTSKSREEIAKSLGRAKSSIVREINRNKDEFGDYVPNIAQLKTIERNKLKYQSFKKITSKVKEYIAEKLKIKWSPEQISGRMKRERIAKISTKQIYRYIAEDKLDGGNLYKLLSHQGKKYKYSGNKKSIIQNRVDISLRPKIVEKKSRIGDWEGDTVVGKQGGSKKCIATLADRKSKFTIILPLKDKTALGFRNTIESYFMNSTLPFKTITFDNGTEFARHQEIANTLGCSIYFARPYRSSDRGLNEHTNGLIRKFCPKKTDFAYVTDADLLNIQNLLNDRPRKSLGFLTPNEVMNSHLRYLNKKYSVHWT